MRLNETLVRARVLAIAIVTVLVLSTFSLNAAAAVIAFDDRASFELATGAMLVGPIPQSGSRAPFSVGDLSFSNVAPSSVNHERNWSTLISEPFDLAINGIENFNVTSAIPIFSFGFDFHEPSFPRPPGPIFPDTCNAPCVDSTFQISLFNEMTPVGTHTFNAPDDVLAFVGIWTNDPFNRIEIRELVGTLDNEFFGNFSIGTTPVPEPSSFILLGVGFFGVATWRRRRSR